MTPDERTLLLMLAKAVLDLHDTGKAVDDETARIFTLRRKIADQLVPFRETLDQRFAIPKPMTIANLIDHLQHLPQDRYIKKFDLTYAMDDDDCVPKGVLSDWIRR